jgi:hypothetical protein
MHHAHIRTLVRTAFLYTRTRSGSKLEKVLSKVRADCADFERARKEETECHDADWPRTDCGQIFHDLDDVLEPEMAKVFEVDEGAVEEGEHVHASAA